MKQALALLSALILSLPSFAGGERLQLKEPAANGLTLRKLEREPDLQAKFSGKAEVAGTFMGYWPEGATNKNYKEPEYILIPNASSKAKLPHYALKEGKFKHSYVVRHIDVQNGPAALTKAAGAEQVQRLLERRVNHVRVVGTFAIEHYVVGVECDSPWARADVVDSFSAADVAGLSLWPQGGC